MPLPRLRLLTLALLVAGLAWPARAQEPGPGAPPPAPTEAPPPAPAPGPDGAPPTPDGPQPPTPAPTAAEAEERLAEEGEEVDVDKPAQLLRIQSELERLRKTRADLQAKEERLDREAKNLAGQEQSPVLARRVETLTITLDQAIGMALELNPDYLVELLRARFSAEGVEQAEAAFDPVLAVEGSYTEGRPPFFSTNQFSGFTPGLSVATNDRLAVSTGITKRFATGTTVRAFWEEARQKTENRFSLNPQYSPAIGVEVTQSLLRGFGWDPNLAAIRVAENNALAADASYADVLMAAVLTVEDAYWALVRAEEELRFQERSLQSALKFLDDTRRRREVGAAADLDVIIAQAGVATRREAVITAESGLEAARDQLLRFCRPDSDPRRWDILLVPVDRPWIITEPPLEVPQAIETARRRRPDVHRALLAIDTVEETLVQRDNELLPQLDVFTQLREDGLGGQHHSAWTAVGEGRFYSWTAGLRLNLPLYLRAERSRLRAAKLDVEIAQAQLRSLDATVILEIRRTIRDVRTAKASIEATRSSRILAARRLRATRTQVEHGTAVPRDVLDDLAALAQAEANEVRAFINYRLSLSRHERAKGTLLDRWVDKVDPRVRRSLDRAAFAD